MLTVARSGASETRESVLLPVFVLSNDVIERVDHRLLVRHFSGDQAVKIRQLQHERFVLEASIGEIAECVEQTSTLRRIEEEEALFVFVDEHLLDGVEHRVFVIDVARRDVGEKIESELFSFENVVVVGIEHLLDGRKTCVMRVQLFLIFDERLSLIDFHFLLD